MATGELIAANVLDRRVLDTAGQEGAPGVFLVAVPGLALPFAIFRAWKVPAGLVNEEIRFSGPSGRLVWRWGPEARRMDGAMDSTEELDIVVDATLDELGMYLVSFIIDGRILGEIEVPVLQQDAPSKLPKEIEEGLRKSDVIWIGTDDGGKERTAPVWFTYKNGRIYVLSQKEPGPEEQSVPGVPDSGQLMIVTRRKGRDTSLDRFHANVRVLDEGTEYEQAAAWLVDRRRSRVGPPEDSLERWRGNCVIAELTPVL